MTASLVEPITRMQRAAAGPKLTAVPEATHPLELATVGSRWQLALDAAQRALSSAGGRFGLPAVALEERRRELAHERQEIGRLLGALARDTGVPAPWLSPVPITPRMLGLDAAIEACLFDLDFVLTDSGALHAAAWAEVFDGFLLSLADEMRGHFRPFDRAGDYEAYLDGRPRIEGIHAFLESRGIHVPEGRASDSSTVQSAYGLASRKGEVVERMLRQHGVSALPSARRYLEACGHAGVARAVLSASTNTVSMLELAHLAGLVDARVDADVMRSEQLRSRPAPDIVLAACRLLDVRPDRAVSFTHNPAGVVAARTAGASPVAVAAGSDADVLEAYGAQRVVASLDRFMEPGVTAPRATADAGLYP